MREISKIGVFLVSVYLVLVICVLAAELNCNGWGCGFLLPLPVLPWFMFMHFVVSGLFGWFVWFFIIVFNVSILYYIGFGITGVIKKIKNKKKE